MTNNSERVQPTRSFLIPLAKIDMPHSNSRRETQMEIRETPELKSVLLHQKPTVIRRIADIDNLLRESAELLITAAKPYSLDAMSGLRWGYCLDSPDNEDYSVSTQAMCAVAVVEILRESAPHLGKDQESRLLAIRDGVSSLLFYTIEKAIGDPGGHLAWTSSTFGKEDIFTATWLKQLLHFCTPNDPIVQKRVDEIILNAVTSDQFTDRPLFNPEGINDAGPHALPLLRVIEAAIEMPGDTKIEHAIDVAGKWFDRNLYRQASFFRFGDFRFDAAELIFCLRGVLVTRHLGRLDSLIKEVLSLVRDAQQRSVYWRPYRPMVSNKKGQVLLPLSIEVATVLLAVLEDTANFDEFGDTLVRYFEWLENQRVVQRSPTGVTGWHSENTYDSNTIHVWDTARVALFLSHYRSALSKSLHRTVLQSSGFTQKAPNQIAISWNDLVPFDLGAETKTFGDIDRLTANGRDFSFLFYGPPGVSKSTLARAIAKARNRRLVELTPSDFISGGEAEIEARAKNVFDALMCLEGVIVFFDEIDQLILDRDSKAYGKQGDIFKFMTPSMLSKLQDLRSYRPVSFIIATNYADHIDRAIKREGRIDKAILCLPHNRAARVEQLRRVIDGDNSTASWGKGNLELLNQLSVQTVLFAYQELRGAIAPFLATQGGPEDRRRQILEAALKRDLPAPQISLQAYKNRLESDEYQQRPYDEYLRLLLLKVECGIESETFRQVINKARAELAPGEFGVIAEGIKAAAAGTEAEVVVRGSI